MKSSDLSMSDPELSLLFLFARRSLPLLLTSVVLLNSHVQSGIYITNLIATWQPPQKSCGLAPRTKMLL